ncbi:probable glycosyltransferase 3 [Panicum virgatum]|uniref:Glycosyltransferase 3 n=1 Tax=Panicum virgatum TaxID=38727 RepID=A0A8T0TS83_PANVG|nr:probable glycosyltransferase 3 [Panicum virgatum]KAG2614881.1 hypothetical protein PVAP13_3NG015890 [Panicum virgatum]
MGTPAAGGWRLPSRGRSSSSKLTQRAINNIRFALLCAFVTLLVLRGTVGVSRRLVYIAGSRRAPSGTNKVVEDMERTLREIRADSDPDPEDGGSRAATTTPVARYYDRGSAWSTQNYSLGPRVTRWNAKRRRWLHLNPGFPSRDARGNPRVLLVTASPPGPCDTPGGDHFLLRATKNRMDYCRLHGIEYAHAMARLDAELTGGWAKLPLLRRLMLVHPEVEWLWWMDGDALVTDMGFELPLARYEGTHLVVHGNSHLLFQQRSWVAVSTGSFLLRNCQWSLELLDAWAVMGPRGRARDDAGRLLTATLYGRPAFEADDQSALIHLLLTEKERWMDKVYLENEYYLHGLWAGLVGKYEKVMEKHHPGYGDDRWPFVTHFVGCKPCSGGGGRSRRGGGNSSDEYPPERCVSGMERAFNFADNQVLRLYGFRHESLASSDVRRVTNRSANPLEAKEDALSFLKKPKDPVVQSHDVRKNRKRKGKKDSVLARVLKRLGWRSEF